MLQSEQVSSAPIVDNGRVDSRQLVYNCYRQNKSSIALLLVCSLATGLLNATFLAIVAQGIDGFRRGELHSLPLIVSVVVGILFFRYWFRVLASYVSVSFINYIRSTLSALLIKAPLGKLEATGSHGQFTLLTRDVSNITAAANLLPILLADAVMVIAAFVYLGLLSWVLLLLTIVVSVTGALIYIRLMKSISILYRNLRRKGATMIACLHDVTGGMKELKTSKAKSDSLLRWMAKANNELKRANMKAVKLHQIGLAFGQGTIYFLIIMVVAIYPRFIDVETSIIVTYVIAILYVSRPIQDMVDSYPVITQGKIALGKVSGTLAFVSQSDRVTTEMLEPVRPQMLAGGSASKFNDLLLEDLEFEYPSSRNARIGPVNFSIKPGQIKVICGANGSGKTTFIKVLLGLYKPLRGRILYNSIDIADVSDDSYTGCFEVVFSDFHILRSIRKDYVTESSIARQFVSEGIRKRVVFSRNEKNISQGEKRRFILESACSSLKPILVFDEPASDLDPEFKRRLYEEVFPNLREQGKAVIIVTHDENYFHIADELIKFRDGVVL